ncbi:MAG: aspartate-semialdehyde dehydrogenase [bacterium P3]|nr:MAG: aspartate-semialdehyde dehydrogenase [bacterium P3]KWW40644.1 MAG: aspartate-semialdehyde dehydrogenase [bacterium F083]
MKIAVVGATGLVGGVMLQVLQERGLDKHDIIVAASAKSVGRPLAFAGRELHVVSVESAIAARPDYAVFSAGADVSRQYAPLFAAAGTTVIDNSSAWRKDPAIPLVVPEINIDAVHDGDRIVANPNCSTVQMVLALSRLHRHYGIRRLVVSTYQSVTGTGIRAVRQLEAEESGTMPCEQAYPYPIHRNLFPHGGDFLDDGYTTEEQKLVDETRKILRDDTLAVTATVARVPVVGGHSESVNVEFKQDYTMEDVRHLLSGTPGVVLCDDPSRLLYPMPVLAQGRDEVFVGRLRRDLSQPNSLNMWIVADNLRKGAATNAIQILQSLMTRRT